MHSLDQFAQDKLDELARRNLHRSLTDTLGEILASGWSAEDVSYCHFRATTT